MKPSPVGDAMNEAKQPRQFESESKWRKILT